MAEEIRLIYFDIRGLVEPLRWMFKLSDTPFTDERIPLDAFSGSGKRNSLEDIMKRRRSIEKKAGGRELKFRSFHINKYVHVVFILLQFFRIQIHCAVSHSNGRR